MLLGLIGPVHDQGPGMPQEIGAAFKSDRFYYQAIQDSAFAKDPSA
ncbi:hypothetical protein M2171_005460 [Bradyrhizobium japonicum USDA 38]|nr:hypothetical protein [Bradyrhizobium japonicum USDA 38]MCS3948841.1 hypothetical protein [Bradyrhizobium japonicum]MCW2218458.1 hypothetical protein [Bradyrhizobium japonicum]MCW2343072.1 hypothetical protein [Bradyrhizobium japonicum]